MTYDQGLVLFFIVTGSFGFWGAGYCTGRGRKESGLRCLAYSAVYMGIAYHLIRGH